MTTPHSTIRCSLVILSIALMSTGCAIGAGGPASGIKSSDPQLVGERDMNYDHLIVPGVRAGPVGLGSPVGGVVQHLGEPAGVSRFADTNEVIYTYFDECIAFEWVDSGVEPKVENGMRGIDVTCDKWATADGLHVGMSVREVVSHLGAYCASTRDDGSLVIATKTGIWFDAPDRNSAVTRILVMPTQTTWGGMCAD